jgi:diacylglycerol kinase (ATP)
MKRKILFVVNPNAGRKKAGDIVNLIRRELPGDNYYQVSIWEDKNEFKNITELIHSKKFSDVVAVGGDGTVNRVARELVHTPVRLGIVPVGSGNGLARSIGINMDPRLALKAITCGLTVRIDVGLVNGQVFLCTSGVGFDAHIGKLFASSVKRGLQSYARITAREIFRYRAKHYTLKFGQRQLERKAFLITVGNAGQYGNDFFIAPQADLTDGQFHVALIKPFNPVTLFPILWKVLRKRAHESRSIETFTTDKLIIERSVPDAIHYDGEPGEEPESVEFRIIPRGIEVICGKSFLGPAARQKAKHDFSLSTTENLFA